METGAAVLFSAAELAIEPEPPLTEGFDRIEIPGLDQVSANLDAHAAGLQAFFDELQPEALTWQDLIDTASGTLDSDLVNPEEQVPQEILDQLGPTEDAIDGAESSFTADAYQETPPWEGPQFWETPPDFTQVNEE